MAGGQKSRMREIASASLSGLGIVGASEIRIVARSGAFTPFRFWEEWSGPEFFHTDLATAEGLAAGGRNEVLLLSPDSHAQAAALTWAKNMVHLVGMYGPAYQNMRSRIGHSAAVVPLLTVSGQGNTFANLYFPYGLGTADVNLLTVTGNRNSFVRCHFLPTNEVQLNNAAFDLVRLGAAETYFYKCYFGGDTIPWTNGNMIEFQATVEPPRVVFEDCMFVMNADNAQVTFLKTIAGLGRCTIIFKRCMFLNLGTSLTLAIDGQGLDTARMIFDIGCTFAGVTDIVMASRESKVWVGHGGFASSDLLNNLIATHPDVS